MRTQKCGIHRATAVTTLVIAAMVIAVLVLAAERRGDACAGRHAPAHVASSCR